ncbi:MAG: hypothetical protein CVT94_05160 [Bacteroidetes bacterium HGW-Bacteroidetes-11]|jgi:hypothetical protein|nr:MAG: hypothetical protein CVT94_05160 [Bacteroidetes bacterium HGW-Bacteroidetes-11]
MERDYLIVFILGALKDCPFGDYVPTCPTIELRKKLSTKQFFGYIRSLTDAELNTLYEQHSTCQNRRSDMSNLYVNNSVI